MARPSSFIAAKEDIRALFEKQPSRIYDLGDIGHILTTNRHTWKIAESMTDLQFLAKLVELLDFKIVHTTFKNRRFIKAYYKNTSIYALASRITNKCYLSHYTSLSIHNLTEQIPKKIYVTNELHEKYRRELIISQDGIDKAFKKPQRITTNSNVILDYDVILHEGKYSGNIGVIAGIDAESGETIRYTNLERTLVDIAVRPEYSGGIYEVLKAYYEASDKISVNRLMSILNKLDYIYPYHQTIGFFLEKTGKYKSSIIELLKRKEMKYDFYLTYNMRDMEYCPKWKIYYPKNL